MSEPGPPVPSPRWAPRAVVLAIALVAVAVAWGFAFETSRHTAPMGLPLDDSYIYLTYAKQLGRGQPFTYFPGGGYSAGSTSVLWPMVLAPFWTLGLRGHLLVWVSFLACAALYAATAIGVARAARRVGGELAGLAAAWLTLTIAPFAFTALSGMEVAFASALLVAVILRLRDTPRDAPPGWGLALALAAASLSRPEATLLVGGICGVACLDRLRRRRWAAAAWFLAPLAAPLAWLVANRALAGNFFPNTGVAKSHFYLPGFDWTYWRGAVATLTGKMFTGLFVDAAQSPLAWPRVFAALWLVGAARVARWGWRTGARLVAAVVVLAPLAMILAVIASSGLWSFQNYRYVAPALPLLALVAGCALAPPRAPSLAARPAARWLGRGWALAVVIGLGLHGRAAWPKLRADMRLFAQGAMDTNTQVVAIGRYLHDRLPGARVMFHDAGAIAYYFDGEVFDMLGLVTNFQAGVANHGPGARFEFLESLPPARRPTHFAYYPGWMGQGEFYGRDLLHTPLRPGFEARRLVGEGDMQVLEARWDHAGTGERPLAAHDGWELVDRLDVADLASERAHGYAPALGRRAFGDPTARWSLVHQDAGPAGLVIDGGRTIRGGGERFALAVDPARPVRLILRTGGRPAYPWHEAIKAPVPLRVLAADGRALASVTLPAPTGAFVEVEVELPAGALGPDGALRVEAGAPYRAFHWFALQPAAR